MIAVFTLQPGKAVVQIAAIKITANDLPEIGSAKPIGPLNGRGNKNRGEYLLVTYKMTFKSAPLFNKS
jgi:hypothetical protein